MNDEIKALLDELEGLKAAVEADEPEAVERAKQIIEIDIPEAEGKKKEEEMDAQTILKSIEAPLDEATPEAAKTIGELAVKSFAGKTERGTRFSITSPTEFKTVGPMTSTTRISYDSYANSPEPALSIRGLFGQETISGNALTYYVMGDGEGTVTMVAENGAKPQIDHDITPVTVALQKVAAYIVETDEMLDDEPWLASACNNRLIYQLRKVEEAQLLVGNGTAPNLTGIANTSGIGSVQYLNGADMSPDDIFKAAMKVQADSGFAADAIVLNPEDYATFRLATDDNGQYLGGGVFYAPYGNGQVSLVPGLWGIPTYLSSAITQGTAIVGAFKQGASVVSKGGIRLEATNSNGTDFVYNRVTVRAEERLALAVRYPSAFVLVDEASA